MNKGLLMLVVLGVVLGGLQAAKYARVDTGNIVGVGAGAGRLECTPNACHLYTYKASVGTTSITFELSSIVTIK